MSSPPRVKQEEPEEPPNDDISSHVATDSETEEIDTENLQPLAPKFASQSKFPAGCDVWYDARKSKASKVLRAKSGSVVGVYFDLQNMRHVYKIKSDTSTVGEEATLYEDRLVYGINCPVTVTNPDTNEAVNGVVVCPKLDQGNDGKQKVSYAVQFTDGKHVSVEFLVAAERIKYREDTANESCGKHCKTEDKKETNNAQEGDSEIKEAKVDSEQEEKEEKNAAAKNEGGELPQTPSPSTVADESKATTSKGDDAVKSLEQIATKIENDCVAARSIAPDEYSKLANTSVEQIQLKMWKGLQSKREVTGGSASPATPSARIDDNEHEELKRSSPLGVARWEPPPQQKTMQRKRSFGSEVGASSLETKKNFDSDARSEASQRPNKMVKTEISESKEPDGLRCALTIPKWVYHIQRKRGALFCE
jgi:hypothetical protein